MPKGPWQDRADWIGTRLFAYYCGAIDDWDGWMTESDYLSSETSERSQTAQAGKAIGYFELKARAFTLALEAGWEGDIRCGPFVSGVPSTNGENPMLMLAWKQDNNGDTMVVSPVPLPWLEAFGSAIGPLRP